MKVSHLILAAITTIGCMAAQAQWQWLDPAGRKVFSDRAPPPDVPERNILKRPGKAPAPSQVAAPDDGAAPTQSPTPPTAAPKKSELDTKLEEKKKQADQAEAAKRKAEEDRLAKARAENCERARRAKATLDSGVRMSTTNAKGEREIMDDTARAAEGQRIQAVIANECK